MTTPAASPPGAFRLPRAAFTLPLARGPEGGPVVVTFRSLRAAEVMVLRRGLAGIAMDPLQKQELEARIEASDDGGWSLMRDQCRPIIEAAETLPPISFDGPREGSVQWEDIHPVDQVALVDAIAVFSCTGRGAEAEALATFPAVVPGGGGDRGGAVVDREPPADAPHHDPGA